MMTDTTAGQPMVDPFNVWLGLDVRPDGIPLSLRMIEQWVVWRAEPKKDAIGMDKVPYQVTGVKASSTKPETWTDFASVLAAYEEDDSQFDGTGFAVRVENGILMLDFDHVRHAHTGEIQPDVLEAVRYLGTYAEISPSGTGIRVIGYGALDHAITSKILQGWVQGRYVTVTGHHLPETPLDLQPIDPERLAVVVAWYADTENNGAPFRVTTESAATTSIISGSRNIALTALGGALRRHGISQAGIEAALLAENAARCDPPLPDGEVRRIAANVARYEPVGDTAHGAAVSAQLLANQEARATARIAAVATRAMTTEIYTFPAHLLNVPGMVGEVAGYLNAIALFPQPVLELAASLAFCGALMGRKIRTESNLRTNLLAIGVIDSGAGKESARTGIKNLAMAAGVHAYIGAEKVASEAGLFNLLAQQPSVLVMLDEFGRYLRAAGNERHSVHLQQLSTFMMELTGMAGSYIIEKRRAEHGDSKRPPVIIHNPNLGAYATTVPGRLFDNLSPEEVVDGFLPRWLVFESDNPAPTKRKPTTRAPDAALVKLVNAWGERPIVSTPVGNLDAINIHSPVVVPDPVIVPLAPHAEHLLDAWFEVWQERRLANRDTGINALWARAYEHALRLALIRAGGNDFESPRITEADAQWGVELADFLISRTAEQVGACVATNEHEGKVQKVERFLKAQGAVKLEALTRKFRWLKGQERKDILDSLAQANLIETVVTQTDGRSSTTVVWMEEREEREERCL